MITICYPFENTALLKSEKERLDKGEPLLPSFSKGVQDILNEADTYFENTKNLGHGFFPVGSNRFYHGGIHLKAKPDQSIRAIADGEVVAWRLDDAPKVFEPKSGNRYQYTTGFVLIKHQMFSNDYGDHTDHTKTWDYYSLYMHLMAFDSLKKQKKYPFFITSSAKSVKTRIFQSIEILTPPYMHPYGLCEIKLNNETRGWTDGENIDFIKNRLIFPIECIYTCDPAIPSPQLPLNNVNNLKTGFPIKGGDIIGYAGSMPFDINSDDVFHLEVFCTSKNIDFMSNPTKDILGCVKITRPLTLSKVPYPDFYNYTDNQQHSFLKSFPEGQRFSCVTPYKSETPYPGVNIEDQHCFYIDDKGFYGFELNNNFHSEADWLKDGWETHSEQPSTKKDYYCDIEHIINRLDINRDGYISDSELGNYIEQKMQKLAVMFPPEWSLTAIEMRYKPLLHGKNKLPKLTQKDYNNLIEHIKTQSFWERINAPVAPHQVWHINPIAFTRQLHFRDSHITGLYPEILFSDFKFTLKTACECLEKRIWELQGWGVEIEALCMKWFGSNSAETQSRILKISVAALDFLVTFDHKKNILKGGIDEEGHCFYTNCVASALFYDRRHRISFGEAYGRVSFRERVNTFIHETMHFSDIAFAQDVYIEGTNIGPYGEENCKRMAEQFPNKAIENADSIAYFMIDGIHEGRFCV